MDRRLTLGMSIAGRAWRQPTAHHANSRITAFGISPAAANVALSALLSGRSRPPSSSAWMPDGHEQEIDADRARALEIGAHRIADRQHAARRDPAPGRGFRLRQRHVVDRPIGLAGIEHLAAHGGVEIGDRAGAIDQPVAALHHHVGIAADHEQLARQHGFEPGAVVLRRLHVVVVEAGADHVVGALQRREAHIEPGEDRAVALGPEVEQALSGARLDHAAGDVAGGDDGVIGLARDMQLVELARHHLALARRIGDQDHGGAARARAHQRVAGMREGGDAVMHHAPDVAQQRRRSRARASKNAGSRAARSAVMRQ